MPTVSHAAEVVEAGGRRTAGQIFLPAQASAHSGETRPEEWINGPGDFFPFLPEGAKGFVILNKSHVVLVAVGSPPDAEEAAEEAGLPRRQVSIECGELHVEGTLLLDVRESRRRVLDYLNRAERFLVLFDGSRRLLVRKDAITRLHEGEES
ncbi:MAG TPA: hypothetical protein VF310_09370 [Vicinamibacteria bacterium]